METDRKDGSPWNTFIREIFFFNQNQHCFFFWICKRFSSSPKVCMSTQTNLSQSSPRLGVSLWALQRMWHIKRTEQWTSQHQTFQKNTAQLGNVLLLVIHHSHSTSDGEVGWSCTDAQHYNQCPVWKEEALRGPTTNLSQNVHHAAFNWWTHHYCFCYRYYRHTFVLSFWNKLFFLFRNVQSHTFIYKVWF